MTAARQPMRRGLGALVLAAACCGAVHAGAIDQLKAFNATTTAARGTFTQSVVGAAGKSGKPSSGTFAFHRPGRFVWMTLKPYEQLLLADGQTLTLYDRDLNQVTLRKLAGAIGSSPAEILFGSGDLAQSFELAESPARDGVEWLSATPRARDTQFSRVDIGLRDGAPVAMQLLDNFGQTTSLAFGRIERNPKLAADTFRFVPPPGADVVRAD